MHRPPDGHMDLHLALSLLGIERIRTPNFDGVSFAPASTHEKTCPCEVGGHIRKDFRGCNSNPHGAGTLDFWYRQIRGAPLAGAGTLAEGRRRASR